LPENPETTNMLFQQPAEGGLMSPNSSKRALSRSILRTLLVIPSLGLISLSGCGAKVEEEPTTGVNEKQVHYLEYVSPAVDEQCDLLQLIHGVEFGPAVPALGNARLASLADGTRIGVRAPMAGHEQPIVRTYLRVEDIHAAVAAAEEGGAMIAYPPTKQGDTGTWAIYIQGGVQHGLWQE
jgi:hypothetical protein